MPRPFLETLRDLRAGRTLEELAEELETIVRAVIQTRKPGELSLKIKIKVPKSGAASYVTVEDSVTTKIPKLDKGDTVFFPTADGSLSRHDPSQGSLDLKPVPPKNVDPETEEVRSAS